MFGWLCDQHVNTSTRQHHVIDMEVAESAAYSLTRHFNFTDYGTGIVV